MAYAAKYYYTYTNREGVQYYVIIQEKDHDGDSIQLVAAERPFTLSSTAQDNQIPYGIKATEAILEFYTGGLVTIEDLYNEDDAHWLVIFLKGDDTIWTGFLQLDNCQERITDTDHILSLNANDGLGRLENLYFFDDSLFGGGNPRIVNWRVDELLANILLSTGLDLQVKAWLNIYENSTEDRTDFDYLTFLTQTAFSTSYFVNDDGTTLSYYEVLNKLMFDFRCMITQAEGCWQIIRWGDVRLFGDGAMPGTLYSSSFGSYSLINKENPTAIGLGLPVHPINENQLRQILRPYQYSKEAFNYEQPPLINQNSLQIDPDATPYNTFMIGDLRYDDYDITTYFPTWVQRGGVESYLEVVTDTSSDPEKEIDRGLVIIGDDALTGGVQFNPIQVTEGDKFDFNLQWRTEPDVDDLIRFWVRFVLITAVDTDYNLTDQGGGSNNQFIWTGPSVSADLWDTGLGIYKEITDPSDTDTAQWMPWSLSDSQWSTQGIPPIPADGVLLIEVRGTNAGSQTDRQNTYFKDIKLTFTQFVNDSTQITGQTHLTEQDKLIKNNLQYDVFFDDSPRNTIKGTLFTDALTDFDYTDINTGAETMVGSIYFTKTFSWHRSDIDEARRLGDLNTNNDLFIQRIPRTIIQGDFFGLSGINLMSIISFSWLPDKRFIFGAASFDYMSGIWNASLYELYDTTETDGDLDSTYTFTYIYETQR